ncbi:MAG: TRAP transporter fused permease subunit [Pseudomonadota bacterium]
MRLGLIVSGEAHGPRGAALAVGLIALLMAAIVIYTPSPLFPVLSDSDTYRALGWERGGEGGWNDFVATLRAWGRGLNRALLDPGFIRPFFVGACCFIAICVTLPWTPGSARSRRLALGVNAALIVLLAFAIWILARKLSLGADFLFIPEPIDVVAAMCGVVVVAELVRRLAGWVMFALIVLAVVYMKYGAPDWLFYQTGVKTWDVLAMNFWLETSGAMGFALSIMIQNVVIFILFGVVIQATGAAEAILKIALAATRRLRGGPAHAAIVSSAMFGTFSGSAAANVVGTGTFTIPLIKSRGFSPRFAGGIEAAASTGGQITPPVMGAAAFYLAEQAQVPYSQVAIAVLLPALFYFGSLFTAVELQARKAEIRVSVEEASATLARADWIKSLAFFAPLCAIIYCLAAGYSVNRAGFWAIAATIAFGLLNAEFRQNPQRLIEKLVQGSVAVAKLIAIVAGLGIFIGVVQGTGLGPKIGTDLALLVENNILLALILTMIASLVLSMGMPTLPAYATIITVMGIFLTQLSGDSTPVLAVHLFVLYFGVLSPVTPPVALAAYAAAPIAGSHPFQTGLAAVRLCSVAFIIPYAFFFHPQLLVGQVDFQPLAFAEAFLVLGLSVWLLTTAMVGWAGEVLSLPSRTLRTAIGALILSPDPLVWVGAAAAVGAVILFDLWRMRERRRLGPA